MRNIPHGLLIGFLTAACVGVPEESAEEVFGECPARQPSSTTAPGPNPDSAPLYDPVLVELDMELPQSSLNTLQQVYALCSGKERCEDIAPGESRPCCTEEERQVYVPATLTFSGETVDAEVRLKGNPTDWDPGDRYQFVVRFNRADPDARFLGLRRMNLEGRRHGALVRNNAAMWVMRKMGLVAPRTNFLKLTLNGQPYAVYENIEGVDREFLEDRFADPTGNLYKHFVARELKTNEDAPDFADIQALHDAFGKSDEFLFRELDCAANVRQWITLAAVEATLPASDNFWSSSYNLYAYNDPGQGWVIIPWDLDDVMYDSAPWNTDLRDGPGHVGDWWERMRDNPTWYGWFLDDVEETLDTAYRGLPAQISEWCCAIRDEVAATGGHFDTLEEFDESCREVMAHVTCRIRYLDDVLSGGQGDIGCVPSQLANSGEVAFSCGG